MSGSLECFEIPVLSGEVRSRSLLPIAEALLCRLVPLSGSEDGGEIEEIGEIDLAVTGKIEQRICVRLAESACKEQEIREIDVAVVVEVTRKTTPR